jgi:uncharacterized protein (DUF1697 family)
MHNTATYWCPRDEVPSEHNRPRAPERVFGLFCFSTGAPTMATHIALLRGINVGGHKMVAMADLRSMLAALRLANPQSLLQSGNLLFDSSLPSGKLERLLEAEAEKRLGLRTDFLVRDASEWSQILARNPFPEVAERDPAHLLVMCLKDAPVPANVDALRAAIVGRESVQADGRQLYIVYPDGIGPSRLTGNLIERKLATRGTARNWNTARKLDALAGWVKAGL